LPARMEQLKQQFEQTVLRPDDRVDLARAGLVIARLAYPDLSESVYLAELDRLGAALKDRITGVTDLHRIAVEMVRLLCLEEEFKGNTKKYYDPDNSYLNRVLDRRLGIPITLSLVFIEVGLRAGLTVQGIGLPGHFIIGLYDATGRILLDPFYRGALLKEEDCRRRVAVQCGGSKLFGTHHLNPVPARKLLARLLRNLKGITLQTEDRMKALQLIQWIIAIDPDAVEEFKERGLFYESVGRFDHAVEDFRKYLTLVPQARDAQDIQLRIERLEGVSPPIH
jgi:regulator of sirC expression with transglutaminase-like and TPR domain